MQSGARSDRRIDELESGIERLRNQQEMMKRRLKKQTERKLKLEVLIWPSHASKTPPIYHFVFTKPYKGRHTVDRDIFASLKNWVFASLHGYVDDKACAGHASDNPTNKVEILIICN